MSLAHFPVGLQRVLQGDFGEAWLEVVAAGHGIDHGRASTTDLKRSDVQLTLRDEEVAGTSEPTVHVQVKTTEHLKSNGDVWSYDLDVASYEDLRRTNHRIRKLLLVVGLDNGETLRYEADGTMLLGATAWVSLEGEPESENSKTQVVYLPKQNRLDTAGLQTMLRRYGVPRSTQVPDLDPWAQETWESEVEGNE